MPLPSRAPPSFPGPALRRRNQRLALAVLLGLTFIVVAWMAAPLLVGLALGTVMGFTAEPLHSRLCARLHGRRGLASALTTLAGALSIAAVIAAVAWVVVRELNTTVPAVERRLESGGGTLLGPWSERTLAALHLSAPMVLAQLRAELGRVEAFAAQLAGVVVQVSAGVLLTVVIALWTMFYVLKDWARISNHLEHLLPLDPVHTRALVDEFRDVGRRAFVGTLAGAALQGIFAWFGFVLTGVPQPMAWAAVLTVTSFIPVIGVPLVWIPAALLLLSGGHVLRAIALVGFSLVVVMAANDYYVKPRLVGRRGDTHPLLMLVSLIGGLSVFGVAGLIVGPVIMSLFVATARILERERS
jgi:predicted PurR-regulated permease PerM